VITETDFLLGVDLRHLVALEAVAGNRSFARAAAQLGYTQSAVSQQIAALERAVGARLLERPRGRNLVEPTEAGALLLRHAERIVASLRAAQADLNALAEGTTGALRIGTFQSIGMSILPTLLSRFRTAWPDVEVTLVESVYSKELLEQIECGTLDLTFEALPLPDGPFEVSELMRDPYVLLVPRASPLARRRKRVTLEDLAELSLVGYRHPVAHGAEEHLRGRGANLRFVFRSDESATVQGLVASGFAAAIVPRLTVNHDDPDIHVLNVGHLVPPRTIVLACHRDRYRSPAVTAFQAMAHEVCTEISRARRP
jgi:DNA-binding transcriptional LysR family regulator